MNLDSPTPHLHLDPRPRGVWRLVLRRPEARNALTPAMVEGIPDLLDRLRDLAPEACRLVVLEGEGTVFCAGADLAAMRASGQAGDEANREDARRFARLFRTAAAFPTPVIASVQGAAIGGGFGLAVASDFVVAAKTARFGTPEARLGLVPAVISPYVVRRLGPGRAAPLLLGGMTFAGPEAEARGIVHRVAPDGKLGACLDEVIREHLESAPRGVREAKALMLRAAPLPSAELEERTIRTIAAARAGAEGQAGTAAFFARTPPPWSPRTGAEATLGSPRTGAETPPGPRA